MIIGKTRSNIGAEIDTQYEILLQMIEDLAGHYHEDECAFNERVDKIYEEASKYDYETYSDMTQGYGEIQGQYYRKSVEARKVLFCAIFSYFESMLCGIIKFYGIEKGRINQFDQLIVKLCKGYTRRFSAQLILPEGKDIACDYYRPLRNYFMHGELNPGKDLDNLEIFVDNEEDLCRNWNKDIEITDNGFLRRALTLTHEFLCTIDESFGKKVREEYNRQNG